GLFTGPLYTIHKALSAAALAAILEERWGRPVVPIFWLAGDDHDFTEASTASWIAADGAIATAALPPRPPEAPLTPMYRVQDGDGFMTRRSRERFDLTAIERIAADEPARLSPNVLLRPAVESAILPTVAYLGGPGELRYLALTPPVYDRLGIPRQLPLPRW